MFTGNKSLIPKFFIYRKKKKEVDKKQKEVDQNNCEMEGTLVKETITFLKTDGTLFNQLNNPQNLRDHTVCLLITLFSATQIHAEYHISSPIKFFLNLKY